MADCVYEFPLTDIDASAALAAAKAAVEAKDGTLTGDEKSGKGTIPTIVGNITIVYAANDSVLKVWVTDKSWLVSCAKIRESFEKALEKAPRKVIVGPDGYVWEAPKPKVYYSGPIDLPAPSSAAPWLFAGAVTICTLAWVVIRCGARNA